MGEQHARSTPAGGGMPAAPRDPRARGSLLERVSEWLSVIPDPPHDARIYIYPLLLVAVGTAIGAVVGSLTGVALPAPVIIAVLVSTWYGGTRSGVVALVAGIPATWLFIAEPRASFQAEDSAPVVVTLTFAFMAIVVGLFYESARDAQRRATHATREVLRLADEQRALYDAVAFGEAKYSTLAESMPAHIVITGTDGAFEYCNQSYFDYTGLTFEQASNWQEHQVIHPDDLDDSMERWGHSLATGEPLRSEMRLKRHDGQYRWFLVNGTPIREDGEIMRWVTVSVDIHDRKAAERALAASEQRASVALSAAGMGAFEWSLDSGDAVWDDAEWSLHGLQPGREEPGHATFIRFVHEDDRERVDGALAGLERDGDSVEVEYRIIRADGQERWLAGWARIIGGGAGQGRRLVGVHQDITERKRDEARRDALVEASQQFARAADDLPTTLSTIARRVIDAIGDQCGIRVVSDDGLYFEKPVIEHRNAEAAAQIRLVLGARTLRSDDIMSERVLASGGAHFEPVVDEAALRAGVNAAYGDYIERFGVTSLIIVPLCAGSQRIGTMTISRGHGADRYTLDDLAFAEEVADRAALAIQNARLFDDLRAHVLDIQQLLQTKEESEERFRLAASAARLGTWEWDMGDRVEWSGSLEEIYGYAPGEFPGTFAAFGERVHPDDRERVEGLVATAMETGEDLDMEHRILLPDGEVRWLNGRGRTFRDASGKPARMIGIGIDITERLQAAEVREALVKDLEAANAAKDEFLGLVSHELKTPITTILGNAYVLEKRGGLVDEESKRQALVDIYHEADRLHRIIDNLLVLARLEQGRDIDVEPILVGRLVEQIVNDHGRQHPERQVIITNEGNRRPVTASPFHVEHVVRNLLSNAEKYSPRDAPIEVRIVREEREVSVSVMDRGGGVPESERDSIFVPFYRSPRTADHAAGIGIGLAVCKRLIEAQHGRIWVLPRPGGGSEFGFALPVPVEDVVDHELTGNGAHDETPPHAKDTSASEQAIIR